MADELVFTVSGTQANPATAATLPEIGLSERQHLQEWVLAHPEILGPNIRIVTFEFDRWWAASGSPLDRLDILGLDRAGRLVVAELKRDAAPDTVEMQAIKYAAMVSRFTPESLGSQHARFLSSRGKAVTDEEALNALEAHTEAQALTVETLRQPRIVVLAASFPPVVTATAVWLREMGLDISLMRFQAYRTDKETLVTVSQLLPVPTVGEFTVVPRSNVPPASPEEYPTIPWTASDYSRLASILSNPGQRGLLDLCAERRGAWIGFGELADITDRGRNGFRADLATLTMLVKRRFDRINWPVEVQWMPDRNEMCYRMDEESAAAWTAAPANDATTSSLSSSGQDAAVPDNVAHMAPG
jgi:hypothetical protein